LQNCFYKLSDKSTILAYLQANLPKCCDIFIRNDKLYITGNFMDFTNKIPASYKYNTTTVRKALLNGILKVKGGLVVDKNDFSFLERSLYPIVYTPNIKYSYYGPYYGFELDGNHKYLLKCFTVTHNTSIVKCIAKALGREYHSISLGGETDASNLVGHNFTYVGSNSGKLINLLKHSKSMDPVILVDELDKINSKDISNIFIHLTDATTNNNYNVDKYFSDIHFDLSKILYIFTYNDESKIDKILLDRLHKIHIKDYTKNEKIHILKTHLLPELKKKFNLPYIGLEESLIKEIVYNSSTTGLRQIKQNLEIILSRVNVLKILDKSEYDNIIKLPYKKLHAYYSLSNTILKEHLKLLLQDYQTEVLSNNSLHMYL
jgi:hypothetical protein